MFKGVYTALVTPLENNKFDEKSFIELLETQIKAGVSGVVPCGTTGESPTLSYEEHHYIIKLCIDYCKDKVQVLAGTGSNSTDEALATTQYAQECGADAALLVTPYYNKPSQQGLYEHFKKIHDNTDIPIILYNIPGRCMVNISMELLVELAKLSRIIGVKDATSDLTLPGLVRKELGEGFCQLSGEDATMLAFNIAGGHGCISVVANIVPKLCVEMQSAWFAGNIKKAQEIQEKLVEISQVLFCETNPVPVKYAASLVGLCSAELRLPLVLPGKESKDKIELALKNLNLI